ncbi:unnamed protein product [Cuscuta epithymum]|uniref:Uncharacterized protein n=1 Tax=Cuscuta epithymum TaxID=186058 RepID=A0AAV0BXG8_9ASTE|nr:unnamed protein product [Cuscuta epithymum]CAH9129464.1 unnamed protein product [Cuscuta epithymum]
MGNFLGCFGGSEDSRKRSKKRNQVIPRDQKNVLHGTPHRATSTEQSFFSEAPVANSVSQATPEEILSLSARKRVTFDDNVTTYEHISVKESTETLPEITITSKNEEEEEKPLGNKQSHSPTEVGSVISSAESYPSNYRYKNCSDIDDDDEQEEEFLESDEEDEYSDDDSRMLVDRIWSESVVPNSVPEPPLVEHGLDEKKGYVRDRSVYVHPVLNPVENLSQWKAMKIKAAESGILMPLKENQELPKVSESRTNLHQNHQEEVAVNASLSNWLTPPPSLPAEKPTKGTFKDRPILGALTAEELNQQVSSSPMQSSPCRSPEEAPIIGSVGTYWNHSDCGSLKKDGDCTASSFKGIPNTTSKYREDKKVIWHSTPFQTRLERALDRSTAGA